jgi:hypothetical protein
MRNLAPLFVVLGLCACGSTVVTSVHKSGSGSSRSDRTEFTTPGPFSVGCDVAFRSPRVGTQVYCGHGRWYDPARTHAGVAMNPSGSLRICHRKKCGDVPGIPLGRGGKVAVGPFRCRVLRAGVRCMTVKTGRGFLFSAKGVKRI